MTTIKTKIFPFIDDSPAEYLASENSVNSFTTIYHIKTNSPSLFKLYSNFELTIIKFYLFKKAENEQNFVHFLLTWDQPV